MPKPEPVKPLSPFEVMEYAPLHRKEWVGFFVGFINEYLKSRLADLSRNEPVELGLMDGTEAEWAAYHVEVIDQFRVTGWIITDGYVPKTYVFKLPGQMINGVTSGDKQENA